MGRRFPFSDHLAALACLAPLALGGCADVPVEPTASADPAASEKIVDGEFTAARPEIGRITLNGGACTATLVRSNVLITASHCVDYRDQQNVNGQFRIDLPSGESRTYTWSETKVFGDTVGKADLALLRLTSAVEPSVATPTSIATEDPPAGTPLRLFGYGCSNRQSTFDDHQGHKQTAALVAGQDSKRLCPGDSGGPVTIGDHGPVYLINSGYYIGSGVDVFGAPVLHRERLLEVIDQWAGANAPPPSAPPPSDVDHCEENGWYGDGLCDADCARPDPDCGEAPPEQPPEQPPEGEQPPAGDVCAENGWYGDGLCDVDCAQPDPDCGEDEQPAPPAGDVCAEEGWYGDGVCDVDCAQPDPDCQPQEQPNPPQGDICEEQGWYDDGICDVDCARPDPDCD